MSDKPRYIVLKDGKPPFYIGNDLAGCVEFAAKFGGTIYEPLAQSTAEQIELEDALAEALRKYVDVAEGPEVYARAKRALAIYDRHRAEIEAAFPKEESDERNRERNR